MIKIKFRCFKRKSLSLLCRIIMSTSLKSCLTTIKLLKLIETINKKHLSDLVEERNLTSGSHDASIKTWDLCSGICLKTLTGHTNTVCCLVKLNEKQLASGSYDNSIKIWDLPNGSCNKTLIHRSWVYCIVKLMKKKLLVDAVILSKYGSY